MTAYLLKRVGTSIISLLVLITVTFFLTRIMPGSPFQTGNLSAEVLVAMEEEYGLSETPGKQYFNYLRNLLGGELGISYQKPGVTAAEIITRAWPATVVVGTLAVLLSVVAGTLLGICHGVTQSKLIQSGIFLGTTAGMAIPNFVFALFFMPLFGVKLRWFPIVGLTTAANYVLPVLALAMYPTAVVTRLMRNAYEQEMAKEYVVMAQAKGISKKRIMMGHVLKNACIPAVNYAGPAAAFMITGSFAVESIFTIPGLGREFVMSISNRDYTMIMALTIFMGAIVIIMNLLTDVLCAWLNPSQRREEAL